MEQRGLLGIKPVVNSSKRENVLAGVVGALLFSLAGGIAWVLLDRIGFIAGISGLIGVVCAMTGYSIFGGKLSKKGIIISVIIAVLVLILAWYCCIALDLSKASKELYSTGDMPQKLSFFESFRIAHLFLADKEVRTPYLVNLIIGLVLAAIGSISYIISYFKQVKQEQTAPAPESLAGYPVPEPVVSDAGAQQLPETPAYPGEIGAEKDPYSDNGDQNL